VRFFAADNLKDLSTEDLDLLKEEIRTLQRGVRDEMQSRQRTCTYCGQRTGDSLRGFKYCSAWHRYLDGHRDASLPSRVEFERKRALHRLRSLRQAAADRPAGAVPGPAGTGTGLLAALRNIRIRQILKEFRRITGEGLRESLRSVRKHEASGA